MNNNDYNFALEAAAQVVEEGVESMSVDREHLLRRRAAEIRALRLPVTRSPEREAQEYLDFLRREGVSVHDALKALQEKNREVHDALKALQEENRRLREAAETQFSLDEVVQAVKTAVIGSLQGLGSRPMHERAVAALRALRGQSLGPKTRSSDG